MGSVNFLLAVICCSKGPKEVEPMEQILKNIKWTRTKEGHL